MVTSAQNGALIRNFSNDPRMDITFKPTTVALVGNGAIRNTLGGTGWDPAIRLIQKRLFVSMPPAEEENYKNLPPDIILSHAGFFSRMNLLAMLRDKNALDEIGYNKQVETMEPNLKIIEEFRQALAKEYKNAEDSGELLLNRLPPEIEKMRHDPSAAIITTNWDESFWKDSTFKNVLQLHGRSGSPRSLILPTEYMADNDNILNIHRSEPTLKDEMIMAAHERSGRGETETRELFLVNVFARNWIHDADNLIIYGSAGHIYDVELHSLFLGSEKNHAKNITIIDKCTKTIDRWAYILRVQPESTNRILVP